ncbi:MAG TPA: hypothetical protein VGJ40_01105 [Gaiellaceae bacterium]|jgi:hypothetical protein
MPQDLPEFETDDELVEWFETADLSQYRLDEVLGWMAAENVSLSIEEPWTQVQATSTGATATIDVDKSLVAHH